MIIFLLIVILFVNYVGIDLRNDCIVCVGINSNVVVGIVIWIFCKYIVMMCYILIVWMFFFLVVVFIKWMIGIVIVCMIIVKNNFVIVKGMVIVIVEGIFLIFCLFRIKIIVDVIDVNVVFGVIVVLIFV